MTIGSIMFRVAEGDITKEEGDAIVNITNETFNLKTGVSRAILNGAGKAVEDECGVLAQKTGKNCIITQAGNLPCKKIMHFVYQRDIRSLVFQVLQECELQQYTSVAFPAIGTGEARRNPAEVADNMIDAVTDFAKRNSATSVKTVKVVIFQPHLMSVFQASMQKREKSTATRIKAFVSKAYHMGKSLWSSEKLSPKEETKVVLEKKINLAVVQICGENKKEVEEAEKWLRSAISKEQSQTQIVDETISHFNEEEKAELRDLENELKICLNLKSTHIEISGVAKDVCVASLAVHKMILRVKAAKETQAKLLQNSIEWKYFEKDSYVPFNSLTNVELEDAYKGKQKTLEVTIGEQIYTVDMEQKTAVDAHGRQISLIRIEKSEGRQGIWVNMSDRFSSADQKSTAPPPTWDHMENEQFKIVELKPDSREYKDVQERFQQTCQLYKIEKVKATANFGNGTYFAVNACYSANDLYSKPDVNGRKYMYLARVLVGEYSLGKKGSITPARKNVSNSVDLYDSSTDNMSQPSMFIIFNDIQAYPEYLITFTKTVDGSNASILCEGWPLAQNFSWDSSESGCQLPAAGQAGRLIRRGGCFGGEKLKQRVLERQSHQLHLEGEGKLRLIVTEPETVQATEEKTPEEKSVPTKVNKNCNLNQSFEIALDAMSSLQTKDDTEALKKAGSSVPNSELQKEVDSAEASPLVVFENIERCGPYCLQMLLENISGLTMDADFTVELIPEINVAVVTFIKNIDTKEFVEKCSQHKRVKEFKMTAWLLESTQSIKAENLPESISTDYLTVYFESTRNGGGPVSDVQLFPEENSAIITFCDHKDLTTVLEKQHLLEQTVISVHPYYHSLGTALYGEARPAVKMPDPFGVPLDPYVWQFLQRHANLTQDINEEMAVCHSELKWPQADCSNPEVMLCPSPSLCKQKKPMVKLLKTWQQDASTEFSRIMACYVAIKCKVNSSGWEDVKKGLLKDAALIITDISEEMVVIAGKRAAVDSAEKEVRECMKQSEREKQSIEISVSVIPGKYAVLHNAGLEENIQKEYPCLKLFYDDKKKTVQLCGLPAEVYKIKAELLEKVLSMPCTSVTIDPHVLHYLQCVDNTETSVMLFIRENINAFYELQDDTVLLYGHAHKDLLEAEKQIKTGLEYKCINVEDGEITETDQWRRLLFSLLKTYNSAQEMVISWQSVGKEKKMIIAGFSKAVTEVYQRLNDFVDTNTIIEKVIPANSEVVVQFVENKESGVCEELKKKGVTVCFDTKTPCVSLRGPKAEVQGAFIMFEKIVSSLYSKNVPIDKPGAKEFFTERKDLCILEAKQKFSCLIRIKEEEEQKGGKAGDKVKREVYYEKKLPGGIMVGVYKGNLCHYPVDVVVNASNEKLKHIGGLADALSRAAGPALQEECDELVRKLGSLQPGCAVITRAGKLPCKNVIHAVGPRWNEKESQKCVWLLKKTVGKCLQLAEIYNHRSIALPAISGGIYGFPPQICAESIVSSIRETLEEVTEERSLKEVHLVSNSDEIVQVLNETVKKVFSAKSFSPKWMMPKKSQKENRKGDLKMVTTNEGLCILVEKKNIQEAMTDVVVNSIGTDLQFGEGPLCKAVLERAGPALIDEFDTKKQSQVLGPGSVVCTSGCAMACKSIFNVVLPKWSGGQTDKVLEDAINFCLKKTEELGLKSITFPAIGTGGFGFPKILVSKLMFDLVFNFSSSHTQKNLQEVHFLLNPQDTDTIQAFTAELEFRAGGSCDAEPAQPSFIRPVSAELLGVHEMKIGSITLQKIIKRLPLHKYYVSIFSLPAGQSQNGFITTQGGNLLCSKIIHLITNNQVKSQVSKVLHECEQRMYKSVAFPAIGTGQAGLSSAKVADEMLDAIEEFARQKSVQHLQAIKIVIFQTHMLTDFYESMKKREDPNTSTSESKQSSEKKKSLILEKKVNLVTFQICGESQAKVNAAESWIKDLILKEQFENTISDEAIENFDETQFAILEDLQRRKQVTIEILNKLSPPQIKISGISRDVCTVSLQVQDMVHQIKSTEEEQCKAELLYNLVEWRYLGSHDSFVAFDKMTNMKLEYAKRDKKPHLKIKIKNKTYTVDLNTLNATDDQGKIKILQRVTKEEGAAIGDGTYFAVDAWYSAQNIYSVPDVNGRKHMYLARVLTGQYCTGSTGLKAPPPRSQTDPTDLYDSVVDNALNPTMFVIFNDIQAYPQYLITFK
ncbi:Poly [ADP-ribose] polymerase 14 [Lonchura striata]|uniref:Poly [ADP-ribose] polymerase n=1 Tax=Lonchura striata TaxID=40157 RepID=A0A218VBH8_9PASE|nr:Poly [ADP-ribose] polymerase 14 [Lonchura striata domestica]